MTQRLLPFVAPLSPLWAFAGSSSAPSQPPSSSTPASSGSFAESATLSEFFWRKGNALDATYDNLQQWKKDNHIPISIGAHHWWHVDRSGYRYVDVYGTPGERGTYYYWLNFDPAYKTSGEGFLDEIGLHNQGRIRDSSDIVRFLGEYDPFEIELHPIESILPAAGEKTFLTIPRDATASFLMQGN